MNTMLTEKFMRDTLAFVTIEHAIIPTVGTDSRGNKCRRERERKVRRRVENRRILKCAKAMGCFLCRTIERELQFHHIDPTKKKNEVANLVSHSAEVILEEILKCMLMCRQCHREHHETDNGQTSSLRAENRPGDLSTA